jgi:hypothetical protein
MSICQFLTTQEGAWPSSACNSSSFREKSSSPGCSIRQTQAFVVARRISACFAWYLAVQLERYGLSVTAQFEFDLSAIRLCELLGHILPWYARFACVF